MVFDLGNVLLSFRPLEYLHTQFTDEAKINDVYKAVFLSKEWLMLDRGTIKEEDAFEKICARNAEIKESIKSSMKDWYRLLTPIEETIDILRRVKENGYHTYILSNFHMRAYGYVTSQYDFFRLFDGGIISYKEKLLKPEIEIYLRLSHRYNIKPEETVFIDDGIDNIDAAKKLSFNTVLYYDPKDLIEKLRSYEIKI